MCWLYILLLLIIGVVIGIIAGYLSGDKYRGFIRYIFISVIGAFIGGNVFSGIADNYVTLVNVVGAIATAIIMIIIVRLIESMLKRNNYNEE